MIKIINSKSETVLFFTFFFLQLCIPLSHAKFCSPCAARLFHPNPGTPPPAPPHRDPQTLFINPCPHRSWIPQHANRCRHPSVYVLPIPTVICAPPSSRHPVAIEAAPHPHRPEPRLPSVGTPPPPPGPPSWGEFFFFLCPFLELEPRVVQTLDQCKCHC